MFSDPDFHDSASRWLDGTDAESPHRLLRELLRDNADAVPAFAALARTEAALHLAGLTENERRRRAHRLIRASMRTKLRRFVTRPAFHWPAAALLIGGLLWFAFSRRDPGPVAQKPRIAPVPVRSTPAVLPKTTVAEEQLAAADADFIRRMSRFIVPEFAAKEVSLAEALETLQTGIKSIDAEAAPVFSTDATVPVSLKVSLHLKYQSVEMLLKLVSIQTGTRFQASGRGYVIFTDPKALPADSFTHRQWERQTLAAFFKQQGKPLDKFEQAPAGDKEALKPKGSSEIDPALGMTKEDYGRMMAQVDQVSAALADLVGKKPSLVLPGDSNITINIRSREDLMLTTLTSFGTGDPPGTWEWTANILYLRTPESQEAFERLREGKGTVSADGTTFTNEDSEGMVRKLSQMENVEMIPLPAVTTRPGATEKVFAGKESSDPVTKPDYWTGMRIQITSNPSGERSVLNLHTTQQGIENPEAPAPAISVSEMSTKVTIEDGRTLLLGGLISENEGETVVFVSARRDPPVPQDLPYGIPVAGSAGMVLSPYAADKGQVDVSGISRGAKVKCPYTGKSFRVP